MLKCLPAFKLAVEVVSVCSFLGGEEIKGLGLWFVLVKDLSFHLLA